MVNSKDFSTRLQTIFEYYDLNASAFADQINVGRASISHVLSGRNKPSLDFVMKIIQTFPEVELYWLLLGKGSFPNISETSKTESPTLFDSSEVNTNSKNSQIKTSLHNNPIAGNNSIEIDKIIVCYKDGSFQSYKPK